VNHYHTLQVSRHAEPEVIDKAYRALSMKHHPDVVAAHDRTAATRRMQRINDAYAVLSDPAARRAYDRRLGPEGQDRSAWDTFMGKGLLGMLFEKMAPPRS